MQRTSARVQQGGGGLGLLLWLLAVVMEGCHPPNLAPTQTPPFPLSRLMRSLLYCQHASVSQALVLTWSGRSGVGSPTWVAPGTPRIRCVRVRCVRLVPQHPVHDSPNETVTPALAVPSDVPYRALSVLPTQVPLLAPQVLAWLVQWDPHPLLRRPAASHVHLPRRRVVPRPERDQYSLLGV